MVKKQLVLAFGLTALCGFAVTAHAATVESITIADGAANTCPVQFTLVGVVDVNNNPVVYGVHMDHLLRKKIAVSILNAYMEKTDAIPVEALTNTCPEVDVVEISGLIAALP